MLKSRLCCLLLIVMLLVPLAASAAASDYHGRCDIIFEVKTTMKGFSGTATCEPFKITAPDNVDDLVRVPVFIVEVASIDTGNSWRNNAMRNMLDYETFPLIRGNTLSSAQGGFVISGHYLLQTPEELSFALTIRDITRKITATVTEPQISSSAIEATLVFDLSLSSFELNPPSFLGIFRAKDTVKVSATMSLDISPSILSQE